MFKFTFTNRQNQTNNSITTIITNTKQLNKTNSLNVVKNTKPSNFVYSSKKVSFIVKNRKDYWDDIKNKFSLNIDIIDYYIL